MIILSMQRCHVVYAATARSPALGGEGDPWGPERASRPALADMPRHPPSESTGETDLPEEGARLPGMPAPRSPERKRRAGGPSRRGLGEASVSEPGRRKEMDPPEAVRAPVDAVPRGV
ncbi:hypothetical protein VaNZ11_005443 [Volvox africanus]|uniref:Uncharacterized protein n=1 Tax=Volvox africanus TaxID=51714 RepID=A0ABQ5RYM4_9CHLO|nr:hypothetical protein VaNZ11_005443 [Volvox africanus]